VESVARTACAKLGCEVKEGLMVYLERLGCNCADPVSSIHDIAVTVLKLVIVMLTTVSILLNDLVT
jgi:hypothetical protein